MRIPPLRNKSLLESNPLNPELLVGGLAVRDSGRAGQTTLEREGVEVAPFSRDDSATAQRSAPTPGLR